MLKPEDFNENNKKLITFGSLILNEPHCEICSKAHTIIGCS